jgi:hypothetical protein
VKYSTAPYAPNGPLRFCPLEELRMVRSDAVAAERRKSLRSPARYFGRRRRTDFRWTWQGVVHPSCAAARPRVRIPLCLRQAAARRPRHDFSPHARPRGTCERGILGTLVVSKSDYALQKSHRNRSCCDDPIEPLGHSLGATFQACCAVLTFCSWPATLIGPLPRLRMLRSASVSVIGRGLTLSLVT